MPATRYGLIASGLALGVSGSGSAIHAMERLSSLLQEKNLGSEMLHQRLSALAKNAVTPGIEDTFKSSLQAVVTDIEGLETKIKASFTSTQEQIDKVLSDLTKTDKATTAAKEAADSADGTWFECVAGEQKKRQDVEAKDANLTSSRNNQEEACQLQQDNRAFEWDASGKYDLTWECDFEAGNCRGQLEKWRDLVIERMFQDAQLGLSKDETHHTGLKNDCEDKKEIQVQAQSALDSAEEDYLAQRQTCTGHEEERSAVMCSFGEAGQLKCIDETSFKHLIETTEKSSGNALSDPDRQSEWIAMETTKCLTQKMIAKGLDAAATAEEVEACASSVDYARDVGSLDTKQAAFSKLASRNTCEAQDVSFYNGQAWEVPEGVEPASSDYTRIKFTPNVNPADGSFDFCVGGHWSIEGARYMATMWWHKEGDNVAGHR